MKKNMINGVLKGICAGCLMLCVLVACGDSEGFLDKEIKYAYLNVILEEDDSDTRDVHLEDYNYLYVYPKQGECLGFYLNFLVEKGHAFFMGYLSKNPKEVIWGWQFYEVDRELQAVMDFQEQTQRNLPDGKGNKYTYNKNTMYLMGECSKPTDSRCDADVVLKHLTLDLTLKIDLPEDCAGTISAVTLNTTDNSIAFTLMQYLSKELWDRRVLGHSVMMYMEGYEENLASCECRMNLLPFVLNEDKLRVTVYTIDKSGKVYTYSQVVSTDGMSFEAGRSYVLRADVQADI